MTDDLRTRIADVLIHAPAEWDEDDTATALLPVVEAHGRAAAATALRQAADEVILAETFSGAAQMLRNRADNLEARP